MNFTSVFIKMIELFLIIMIGYIANKTKVFGRDARASLSKLVINIALPGTILSSVLGQDNLPEASQILSLILIAVLSYVILFASAFFVPKLLRVPSSQKGIYRFMLAFGNVGFIGFPVTEAIFGKQAIFYTSVFNLPFNVFVYSIGIAFLAACGRQEESENSKNNKNNKNSMVSENSKKSSAGLITWKTFVTPCMISSILAIVLALFHAEAPALISDTCTMIGNITTPAALMIIGSSLADMPIRQMFNNFRIYLFSLVRLILIPLATYVVFGWFIHDRLLLGICVIVSAMPVASNGTMLCLQYHADEELMAQGTFLTTVFSIFTIPLLALLFM